MSGGKFFNGSELQQNNMNNNMNNNMQDGFISLDAVKGNGQMNNVNQGQIQSVQSVTASQGDLNNNQMVQGNPMVQGSTMVNAVPQQNSMGVNNSMNQAGGMSGAMSQPPVQSDNIVVPNDQALQSNVITNTVVSNDSMTNPMVSNSSVNQGMMQPATQNVQVTPVSSQNMTPYAGMQNQMMNQNMAVGQSVAPMHQEPISQNTVGMIAPNAQTFNPQTGLDQGAVNVNQSPVMQDNLMSQNNLAMSSNQTNAPVLQQNPMIQGSPMNNATSMPNNVNGQQPMVMNSNKLPTFNNSLNGISPLDKPVDLQQKNDLKMKTKLKLNLKIILLVVVVFLIAIAFVLCLVCYKTTTCTTDATIYGAPVKIEVKAYLWFGKINKIVTTQTLDISGKNEETKKSIIDSCKEREDTDSEKVEVKDDQIIITVVTKPTNAKEANTTADDFVTVYEENNFTCK